MWSWRGGVEAATAGTARAACADAGRVCARESATVYVRTLEEGTVQVPPCPRVCPRVRRVLFRGLGFGRCLSLLSSFPGRSRPEPYLVGPPRGEEPDTAAVTGVFAESSSS